MIRLVTLEAGEGFGAVMAAAVTAVSLIALRVIDAWMMPKQEAKSRKAEADAKRQAIRDEFQAKTLIEIQELIHLPRELVSRLHYPTRVSTETTKEIAAELQCTNQRIFMLSERLHDGSLRNSIQNYLGGIGAAFGGALTMEDGPDEITRIEAVLAEAERMRAEFEKVNRAIGKHLRPLL